MLWSNVNQKPHNEWAHVGAVSYWKPISGCIRYQLLTSDSDASLSNCIKWNEFIVLWYSRWSNPKSECHRVYKLSRNIAVRSRTGWRILMVEWFMEWPWNVSRPWAWRDILRIYNCFPPLNSWSWRLCFSSTVGLSEFLKFVCIRSKRLKIK